MSRKSDDIRARLETIEHRIREMTYVTDTANRWLTATAIFLALLAFAAIFAGFWGLDQMQDDLERSRSNLAESQSILDTMRNHQREGKELSAELRLLPTAGNGADVTSDVGVPRLDFPDELLGYRRVGEQESGNLTAGSASSFDRILMAPDRYTIVGMCDEQCRDIDLAVYDANEQLIEEDVLDDNLPFVSFDAEETGTYRIRMKMWDCTNDGGCAWRTQIYRAGTEDSN